MFKRYSKILVLIALIFINVSKVNSQEVVSIAQEHFNKFNDVNGGWLASDATISLLLPDGKTLWLFGDCFVGEKSGAFGIEKSTSTFINNAAIIDDGNILTTYYGGTTQNPSSLIPKDGDNIFWPEHATIENDTIKIFAIKIIFEDTGIPGFNFRVGRTHLASFKYPEMKHISTDPVEYITDSTMRFGTHVLKRDDFTYIFGKKDTLIGGFKYPLPMLARVENSVSEPWEFYAGSGSWSFNCKEAEPIGDRPMSESFFVYEKNNKFYLIMHEIWLIGELYILESDEITGPWNKSSTGGVENLFCMIPKHGNNFTYNLFAHPQFTNDEKILISFNVNTSVFNSIYDDTRNYRGRFLWLSVEDAVTKVIPDTVYIFKDFEEGTGVDFEDFNQDKYFEIYPNKVSVKNIHTQSVLSVYSVDGRMLYYQSIVNNTDVVLENYPNTTLIIKLVNKEGVFTKKIINSK